MTDNAHPAIRGPRPPPSEDEMLQIESAVARLVACFPAVPPLDIDIAVRTAEKRFADAKIRAYVPLLIEKSVRHDLGGGSRAADRTRGVRVAASPQGRGVHDDPLPRALDMANTGADPSGAQRSGAEAMVCGITAAIGYGLGVCAAFVWRAFADRDPRRARRRSWYVFFASAVVLFSVLFGAGQW